MPSPKLAYAGTPLNFTASTSFQLPTFFLSEGFNGADVFRKEISKLAFLKNCRRVTKAYQLLKICLPQSRDKRLTLPGIIVRRKTLIASSSLISSQFPGFHVQNQPRSCIMTNFRPCPLTSDRSRSKPLGNPGEVTE